MPDVLEDMVREADKRAFAGRVRRLKQMLAREKFSQGPFDTLALEYHEEARLCWVMGSYVACIILCQMAFEQTLRAHFWLRGRSLPGGRKVNDALFTHLIGAGVKTGLLTPGEGRQLNGLRKQLRNPYVHPKLKYHQDRTFDFSRFVAERGPFVQAAKIQAPTAVGKNVESEARGAISLLVGFFPVLSARAFR